MLKRTEEDVSYFQVVSDGMMLRTNMQLYTSAGGVAMVRIEQEATAECVPNDVLIMSVEQLRGLATVVELH